MTATAPDTAGIVFDGQLSPAGLPPMAFYVAQIRDAAEIAATAIDAPGFVPDSMLTWDTEPDAKEGTPGVLNRDVTIRTVTIAMLTGYSLGLDPWTAIRSMDVIKGVPALRAQTYLGLARRAGHKFKIVESTATRCIIQAWRLGDPAWETFEWNTARATAAGLLPGNERSMWRKMPQNMLLARCKAEAARWVGADTTLGAVYTSEELTDDLAGVTDFETDDDADGAPAAPRRRGKGTRRRDAVVVPALPTAPPVGPASPGSAEGPPPKVAGQAPPAMTRRMFSRFTAAGITDAAAQLAKIREWTGNLEIAHRDRLTIAEANTVLGKLDELIKAQGEGGGK